MLAVKSDYGITDIDSNSLNRNINKKDENESIDNARKNNKVLKTLVNQPRGYEVYMKSTVNRNLPSLNKSSPYKRESGRNMRN